MMNPTQLSERVVTTMSFIGQCDNLEMQKSIKEYTTNLAQTLQQNQWAGQVHRYDDAPVDGKRKNESNTRTLVNTNLRWDRCGSIHKVCRSKPYLNKALRWKKNFKNAMEIVTDQGITAKLFTNGRISGSGYRSEAEFNDFNNTLVGGLFPGSTMRTIECCLVHSRAQLALGEGGLDTSKLLTELKSGAPPDATIDQKPKLGCIVIRFSVRDVGGSSISVFSDGGVQVVAKSHTDDERMWNLVRSFVVPRCLRCV